MKLSYVCIYSHMHTTGLFFATMVGHVDGAYVLQEMKGQNAKGQNVKIVFPNEDILSVPFYEDACC